MKGGVDYKRQKRKLCEIKQRRAQGDKEGYRSKI